MASTAKRTNLELWKKVKQQVTEHDKGGNAGQWSARKAQLAVSEYKKSGGGYSGEKASDNHLAQWTREDWGTKSGKQSLESGERYLPKAARAHLTDAEYEQTTAKKRADMREGKQFSSQPASIRLAELPLAELRRRAAAKQIAGRSRMTKQKLVEALS